MSEEILTEQFQIFKKKNLTSSGKLNTNKKRKTNEIISAFHRSLLSASDNRLKKVIVKQ